MKNAMEKTMTAYQRALEETKGRFPEIDELNPVFTSAFHRKFTDYAPGSMGVTSIPVITWNKMAAGFSVVSIRRMTAPCEKFIIPIGKRHAGDISENGTIHDFEYYSVDNPPVVPDHYILFRGSVFKGEGKQRYEGTVKLAELLIEGVGGCKIGREGSECVTCDTLKTVGIN